MADDFFSGLISSAGQDGPGWEDTHFLARLTSVQTGTGAQAGLNLYGFAEQAYDPTTGFPVDASGGRTDNLTLGATTYALEMSNAALTVPGTTPAGFTNAGPYVWLKLRGAVNGGMVYEFTSPSSGAMATASASISPFSGPSIASGASTAYNFTGASIHDESGGQVLSVSGTNLYLISPGFYLIGVNVLWNASVVAGKSFFATVGNNSVNPFLSFSGTAPADVTYPTQAICSMSGAIHLATGQGNYPLPLNVQQNTGANVSAGVQITVLWIGGVNLPPTGGGASGTFGG